VADRPEVLFVCVHNAGRSQMAATLLDHHANGKVVVRSAADVVITMGCGDACPIYPGKRYEDWQLDDPAGQPIEKVRQIRDDIDARIRQLLDELAPASTS
jgi:arsenate reductase